MRRFIDEYFLFPVARFVTLTIARLKGDTEYVEMYKELDKLSTDELEILLKRLNNE